MPGCAWHFLRTWGWWIAFPDETRPAFTRLFRVRLAADAISFFTIRGITNCPDRGGNWLAEADLMLSSSSWDTTHARMSGLIAEVLEARTEARTPALAVAAE